MEYESIGAEIVARYDKLKSDASNWFDLFQDIAMYFAPRYASISTQRAEADLFEDNLYVDIGRQAANEAAAGFLGQMAPVGQEWFRLEADYPEASQNVRDWFASSTKKLEKLMSTSDFYNALHNDIFMSLVFGTSDLTVETGKSKPFSFKSIPVGRFLFENNDEDEPDVAYQSFKWSLKQIVDRWGEDVLPDKYKNLWEQKHPDCTTKKHEIIQCIRPREDSVAGLVSEERRPYAEYFVFKETKDKIYEGGFYENPHIISRHLEQSDTFWGYSIGMQTLAKIRQLNDMEECRMLALEKMGDPGWLMPDDGMYAPDNRPRGITYFRADSQHLPQQIDYKNRPDLLLQDIEIKKEELRKAWYSDVFRMLQDMPNPKTATEILALQEERLILFSQALTLYQKEKLNRIIERCFAIALREGLLSEPPPEIVTGGDYRVVYTSRIALSSKSQENAVILNALRATAELAAVDNTAMMVPNIPKVLRRVYENMGIDPDLINSAEEVNAMAAQQRQMAALQQGAQTAESATKALSNLQ